MGNNASVYYEVRGMTLILQDMKMACWYASAMMLLAWREKQGKGKMSAAIDDATIKLYKANNGLQNSEVLPLAKRLGLVAVPPQSPTIQGLTQWLTKYGPLWTNGTAHIVVIAGIRGNDDEGYEVQVYDPKPGNGVTWRSLAGWYTGFDPGTHGASSRDISLDVKAVFLHA